MDTRSALRSGTGGPAPRAPGWPRTGCRPPRPLVWWRQADGGQCSRGARDALLDLRRGTIGGMSGPDLVVCSCSACSCRSPSDSTEPSPASLCPSTAAGSVLLPREAGAASDPDSGARPQRASDGIRDHIENAQRHGGDADGTAGRSNHALAEGASAADPGCDGAGAAPFVPPPIPLPQSQPRDQVLRHAERRRSAVAHVHEPSVTTRGTPAAQARPSRAVTASSAAFSRTTLTRIVSLITVHVPRTGARSGSLIPPIAPHYAVEVWCLPSDQEVRERRGRAPDRGDAERRARSTSGIFAVGFTSSNSVARGRPPARRCSRRHR